MKNIIIRIVLLAVTATATLSCKDALDIAPDGKTSFEDIFGNNYHTEAYLNSCYSYVKKHGAMYYFWSRGPALWSDEAWDADDTSVGTSAAIRLYNGNASASDHPILNALAGSNGFDTDHWNSYWTGIRKCTFFLQNVGTANLYKEENRRRLTAEARILRAYYYSELLRWFGCGMPIMDTEIMDWNTDFSNVTRSSYYEVVQFVIRECNTAIECEDVPWRITQGGEAGRVTRAMAEAIRSRVILFAASPLYNDGTDLWQTAYEVNKAALESLRDNGYELYKELKDNVYMQAQSALPNVQAAVYNEYFCREQDFTSAPVDCETIYQRWSGWYGNLWDVDGIGIQDGYKAGTCPSQELVDSYEMATGKPILDLANPYSDEKHTVPNYAEGSGYNPQDPYAGRDPRFYASIYYNGSQRYANWAFDEPENSVDYPAKSGFRLRTINTYVGEDYTGISETSRTRTRTGYYHRKFLHPRASNNEVKSAASFKIFRLGEVILNFAEAAAEYGTAESLVEAWNAVNEIRDRVGMPALPEGLKTDKAGLILRIRNERRVELAFEEHRYFDVRRWTEPDGNLAGTDKWVTAMEITRNPETGVFSYKRRPVRQNERLCYTNQYLKCPIPLKDVNIMREATGENWQNPGW